eukprot:TRINITY_DN1284_c0_g1_i2.p1 TRINITY_DN1284_c0_g1~~TRINITY_DN1284_c0_g1_i2.p1  ORF type:complete len:735 (+),score=120.46 TRINITY_DN1284_c0_g1_i2:521-2725(+)
MNSTSERINDVVSLVTRSIGTIKVVDQHGFTKLQKNNVYEYPSLQVKTSTLWYYPSDGDKGFLVEPKDDALHFAFHWMPSSLRSKSKEAFVTLVGSNDHVLGARALGKSIELLGTKKDRVALVTKLVSLENLSLMEREGWRVAVVPFIENPFIKEEKMKHLSYQERHERGRRKTVLCKLHIWNLVEYESVFYLDTDVIMIPGLRQVKENCDLQPKEKIIIDNIFDCGRNGSSSSKIGQFCALQHGYGFKMTPVWEFNAGILVVKPSRAIFRDILTHARWLGTNSNYGDQGTLARYFFYTCASEGKFLLGDPEHSRQVSQLQCKFPDFSYLATATPAQKDQFEAMCDEVGHPLSTSKYTLLPKIYRGADPTMEAKDIYSSPLDKLFPPNNSIEDPRSEFEKEYLWRKSKIAPHIEKLYTAEKSGCQQLNRIWQTWITDDTEGVRQCKTAVVHFLDPDRKPWFWHAWPVSGYYQMWREVVDSLDYPWSDIKTQAVTWSLFPALFSFAWFLLLFSIERKTIECETQWNGIAFLNSMDLPLSSFWKCIYNQSLKPAVLRTLIHYLPFPFDPLLCNWERISVVVLFASSVIANSFSYQITPSRLPPAVGWFLYFEWSLFICTLGVSSWAFFLNRFIRTTPDTRAHKLNHFESLPTSVQSKDLAWDFVKLAALHVALDATCLAVLFVCGRGLHLSWNKLLSLLPYIVVARILSAWLIFVKKGLCFLRKLVIFGSEGRDVL